MTHPPPLRTAARERSSRGPRVRAFVAAAVAWAISAHGQPKGEALAWKWEEGQAMRYRALQEMHQEIVSGGESQRVDWTVVYGLKQRVVSVSPSGVARVEQTYDTCSVTAREKPGEEAQFDSADPKTAKAAQHRLVAPYAAFLGETITFEVGPEGDVRKLDGASKILEKINAAVGASNPLVGAMLAKAGGVADEESLRRELERALRVVPGETVPLKGTWSVDSVQPTPLLGDVGTTMTYKLENVSGREPARLADIRGEGSMSVAEATGGALAELIQPKLTRSVITSTVIFSISQGRIMKSTAVSESDWSFELKSALVEDGEAITQRLKQRAELEWLPGSK